MRCRWYVYDVVFHDSFFFPFSFDISLTQTAPAKHEASEKNKQMSEFYAKHNIAEMISRLTGVLMRDKPADPIAHVIQHLLSPEKGITKCDDVTPFMNDESKAYLLKHKIHYLFDEFLNNMLDDMPVDENGVSVCNLYYILGEGEKKKKKKKKKKTLSGCCWIRDDVDAVE